MLSFNAYSHTDTVLQVEGVKLIGLPNEYSPSEFDFKKLKLSIAGKTIVFPKCIKPEFNFEVGDLLITSPLYHSGRTDTLPSYIIIGHEDNYPNNLLISMDSLLPIPIEWGYGANETQKKCIDKFKAHAT